MDQIVADDEQQVTDPVQPDIAQTEPMAIVGIGVCAASLDSLGILFAGLAPQIAATYLVAVRQKEGLSVESVLETLNRQSSFPAKIGADGEVMAPNHIYVGGPEDMITIVDGHIHIRPAAEPAGHRGTIDSILI